MLLCVCPVSYGTSFCLKRGIIESGGSAKRSDDGGAGRGLSLRLKAYDLPVDL